ncbi:MAG: hypothetical protein GF330_04525 [Candidatus Eisenbacteria bacterium]|nr:hypothetical protein [Candidatus Eisenbacteria bacterium]
MPFLTLEDPNAKIKGSRDPLGTVPLWSAFGRHIVTNITTVSTSVRGFTILLLARYFSGRLIEDGTILREETLNAFLRMEQAGAYARYVAHGVSDDIRGIERVMRFDQEYKGRVPIHADRRGLILSDQKVYGLWGLYSVPARRSGWLTDEMFGLTPAAQKFVEENYIARLNGSLRPIMKLVARGGTLETRKKDPAFTGLAGLLAPEFTPNEQRFYGHYLRDGLAARGNRAHALEADDAASTSNPGETTAADHRHGRQSRFRHLLESHADLAQPMGREEALRLAESARDVDEALASALERIVHLESLLAPATALFEYVLTRANQLPAKAAGALRERWGDRVPNLDPQAFEDLIPEISDIAGAPIAATARRCHHALAQGDYNQAIRAVVDWNALVQQARKGAPWVVLSESGRIEVRYRMIEHLLPEGDALPTLWRNSYFVDALKSVTRQLQGKR